MFKLPAIGGPNVMLTPEEILANRRAIGDAPQERPAAPVKESLPERDDPGRTRAAEFQTTMSDAKTLVKSFNAAADADDLQEMVRLFNGEQLNDAIRTLTAQAAHGFVERHWRGEIEKNGERKPVQYTQDVHSTLFFMLKLALSKIERLEVEVQNRAAIATARLKRQNLRYVGTYKHGEVYTPGNFATHDGSVWACVGKTTDPPPGDSWVLAVRKGRDAR